MLHSADSCGYMDNYRELKIRCDPGFGHLQVYQRSDTVYLDRTKYEYRYRLLRDTIYKTQIDSIPYEVHIETVREVPRRRNILDYISYACLGLVIGCVLTRLYHYFR